MKAITTKTIQKRIDRIVRIERASRYLAAKRFKKMIKETEITAADFLSQMGITIFLMSFALYISFNLI